MQPIFTQTIGAGGASSITFNNIPQGFTDLKIMISGRSTTADSSAPYRYIAIAVNGDTTSKYTETAMFMTNTIGQFSDRQPYGTWVSSNLATSGVFSASEVYISNYTSGNDKSFRSVIAAENNGSTVLGMMMAGLYRSTAPITSLTFYDVDFANMVENSTFTLYGISNVYDAVAPVAPTISSVTDQAGFAAVAFTPAASDRADIYKVTSSPSGSTTYGYSSPIKTPAALNTAYTYQVASVNALGTTPSAASGSLTTANNYASIATATLSGSTGSVEFTNIPQHYTHLQVRVYARSARSSANDSVYMRMNGDSNTSYSWHTMYGDGSGNYLGGVASDNTIQPLYIPAASASSNIFGYAVIDFLDYTNNDKFKTVRSLNGYDTNGSGLVCGQSGAWRSYAPISSLLFANYFTSANFAAGTVFALYGIG
jgi:anti-sigma-K factor RskA